MLLYIVLVVHSSQGCCHASLFSLFSLPIPNTKPTVFFPSLFVRILFYLEVGVPSQNLYRTTEFLRCIVWIRKC